MTEKMILKYGDTEFEFDCSAGGSLSGRLRLNGGQRAHLKGLLEREPEDWFLDRNGERLPAEQLFSLSPWSCETPDGTRKKLLSRSVNIDTGEALFSTAETYGGETFSFLRNA
jgi:hypothetical protein